MAIELTLEEIALLKPMLEAANSEGLNFVWGMHDGILTKLTAEEVRLNDAARQIELQRLDTAASEELTVLPDLEVPPIERSDDELKSIPEFGGEPMDDREP